jgi:hypothetical protein
MGKFNSKVEPSPGKDCVRSSRFHCIYICMGLRSQNPTVTSLFKNIRHGYTALEIKFKKLVILCLCKVFKDSRINIIIIIIIIIIIQTLK